MALQQCAGDHEWIAVELTVSAYPKGTCSSRWQSTSSRLWTCCKLALYMYACYLICTCMYTHDYYTVEVYLVGNSVSNIYVTRVIGITR